MNASASGSRSWSICDQRSHNHAWPSRYARSSTGSVMPRRTRLCDHSRASTGITIASGPAPLLSSRRICTTLDSQLAHVSSRSSPSSRSRNSGIVANR